MAQRPRYIASNRLHQLLQRPVAAQLTSRDRHFASCRMSSVCQSCGACCASFRVSFYWAETDAHPEGRVPAAMTVPITPYHVAMRGTEQKPVRCAALTGTVGIDVGCDIYLQRSSTCREFHEGDERCNDARARHGLAALMAEAA
ncbi:YkgJ family cysteine cluster protein [Chitinibacteraceae bacterium HSL-7]